MWDDLAMTPKRQKLEARLSGSNNLKLVSLGVSPCLRLRLSLVIHYARPYSVDGYQDSPDYKWSRTD